MEAVNVREAMQLMPQVEQRAKEAKLSYAFEIESAEYSAIRVSIPRLGGTPRDILISPENVAFYLAANFEHWSFIEDRFAIDRGDTKEVELALSPHSFTDARRLMQLGGYQEFAGAILKREFTNEMVVEFAQRPQNSLRIRIGRSTPALQMSGIGDSRGDIVRTIASLFIAGLSGESRRPERLAAVIADITNATLFDLAVVNGINVEAMDYPRLEVVTAQRFNTGPTPRVPQSRYSPEASSLFRYAQSADRQPLLRFLAFYQVMEHFFPTYTEIDTLDRIRQIVIDPSFNSDDRTKLARLAQAIRSKSFPSEKEQIRSTIQHCVDVDDLKAFINESPERAKFVGLKKDGLRYVRQISQNDQSTPLTSQVADRIYEIRCRIVHAKDGGGPMQAELLLPFGSEAKLLGHDIDIARFVAEKILVANARPTSWA
ncbi:hypothetical protein Val02_69010 [Virgisporangium aliadipatigenens]|uniref:Uncharacterized protein n=1 Tax=Virgisporangium aliadipatigenens TaxID=741659 RepID=A0A8J3YUC4_9ACTN|nr:hypothetical protein [Virgisporangium aliadipatigenens]GIJ50015.1 hypothetical protein Val02_69010 [Virgisporangium aliadipatigenens]